MPVHRLISPDPLLLCYLSDPDGDTVPLAFLSTNFRLSTEEIVLAWQIPARVTNLAGCTVHFQEAASREDVATLQLQPTPAGRNGSRLTAAQAGALAQRLANNQAQSLYGIRPFRASRPAEFVHGSWAWHYRRGWGRGDVEATVKFAADGASPSVSVTRILMLDFD